MFSFYFPKVREHLYLFILKACLMISYLVRICAGWLVENKCKMLQKSIFGSLFFYNKKRKKKDERNAILFLLSFEETNVVQTLLRLIKSNFGIRYSCKRNLLF